ncbi:MAG: MATE family efflux transporter [Spirochaetales bacterium]|nr:MATE family efflux transporter [Spirochaetales bacterium]MBQ4501328.1 MATE family efflux transporter [Spirochaetales bacterium]
MSTATSTLDFTEGSLGRKIIKFSLPLFLGNLFQQLYNAADSLIVGNTLGPQALASVSSSGSLIFMMVGFFNGLAIGAGVVISKYFGARDQERMQKAIHTDLAFGLVAGLFLTVFGVLMTPHILAWMRTPQDIIEGSITYFRIYSFGILFCVMYNITMGIMNATGDSTHPLIYLLISSVTNIILDLFFIKVLHWGVGGAAAATTIGQALSFILCMIRLVRTDEVYKVYIRNIRFDIPLLKEIIRYGLPSGIQNSVIAIANVFVQSNYNTFSSVAVAGCGSYAKIEGFAFIPINAFVAALTTCISQNLGAGNHDRARRGARFGILVCMALAETIGLLEFIFAKHLIALFNSDPEVIAFGVRQIHVESLFYFLLALSHSIAGVMRGAGKAKVPMFVMLGVWCIFRVLYITVAMSISHTIELVFAAYPITWSISSVIFLIYLLRSNWVHGLE